MYFTYVGTRCPETKVELFSIITKPLELMCMNYLLFICPLNGSLCIDIGGIMVVNHVIVRFRRMTRLLTILGYTLTLIQIVILYEKITFTY